MKNIASVLHLQRVWSQGWYAKPKPLPRTRSFWLALGLVSLAVLVYSIYFCIFLTSKHNAFQTNGEDLGIMDQALWNVLHGSPLHQTICNILTDTNCYNINGVNRFAIHFEPILFPIALLYLIWSSPIALMIFQVLVVASGAFPAFWLARLRLRNDWAAFPFALLYLLYPAQQYAVNFDFHPETLTISLLLFTLYFLYTRKTVWLFVFAVLCLACKEEIAGVIFLLGLWTMLLQRRGRVGLGLAVLALCWTGIGLLVVHFFSPVGHSLLAARYAYLGNSPLQMALTLVTHPLGILKEHVLEPSHMLYLRKLLSPMGYLPLLAPWVLVLAVPTLALNLLSSMPNMYSGNFQYNAEVIPVLIFASIEATFSLVWVVRWLQMSIERKRERRSTEVPPMSFPREKRARASAYWIQAGTLLLILSYLLIFLFRGAVKYDVYSAMPYARGFVWPQASNHDILASRFLNEIPADASVSTQTTVVPHLSQRKSIYLFPYGVGTAQYILLDAPGHTFPFSTYDDYASAVKTILQQGTYGVVDMDDGYILLKQGAPPSHVSTAAQMIDDDVHDNMHTD